MLKRIMMCVWLAVIVASPVTAFAQDPGVTDPPKGFTALFNGKDLTGWWGLSTEDPAKWMALPEDELAAKVDKSIEDIHKHWSVKDGVLINDGHGLYLSTRKNYGDFEFLIDYKTVAKADSGIYLRGVPQVQIWDTTKEGGKWNIGADKGSGGLWNNSKGAPGKDPLVLADKPFGEWNHFRIVMVGEYVTIYLNDKLVVDHARLENYFDRKGNLPKVGPIQLQTHGGEIQWRNVFIREIGADEATRILRNGGADASHNSQDDGFRQVFNGNDFTGWEGPTQNYEVKDGALVCKPGKGGTIYTKDVYGDFHVRFEFRLPPGGNNGLAIRYPGQGDPAYTGLCELQVLDNAHEKYAKLHPAQYHASVYGRVPARRGYLRQTGQWNYQEVFIDGMHVKVVLNGYVIQDVDLSKVDPGTFMYPAEKFAGRDRTEGHFGFAGHGDAVAFRNVEIKRLK